MRKVLCIKGLLCVVLGIMAMAVVRPQPLSASIGGGRAPSSEFSAPSAGVTFYVAPNGSDSNPGTSSLPWRTIQKAANTMVSGDTTTVLAGDYSDQRVQVTKSGASGARITFQASGAVSMKGFTVNADNIAIVGFDITNTDEKWDQGWGIFVTGSNCLIENNYIHFATEGGIRIFTTPGNETKTNHCTVRNNRLYRNALAGIEVYGRDNLVENNEIWGTIQYHPNWTKPHPGADADGMRFFGQGHIIRSNYIHDLHYGIPENVNPHMDCFQTWADSQHEAGKFITFERNFCTNLDSQSSHEVGQGFMTEDASNLTIRNNIIQAYRGINAWRTPYLTIINNDFTGNVSATTAFFPKAVDLNSAAYSTIENNIFYNLPSKTISVNDSTSTQGLNAGYNLAYRIDGKLIPGSPYPGDLRGQDPLFLNPIANDFHLETVSPAIDKGVNLASVTDDRDGISRPQGAQDDIGAYELPAFEVRTSTPTQTITPVPFTFTPTATATRTLVPPTQAPTATATATRTPVPPTQTPTATPTTAPPTPTATPTLTATTQPPTPSSTPTMTSTQVPPSATATATGCSGVPGKPKPRNPKKGGTVSQLQVLLEWKADPCAASYSVIVKQNSKGGPTASRNSKSTEAQFLTQPLTAGSEYFWRVTACNSSGCTKSVWRSFSTSPNAE